MWWRAVRNQMMRKGTSCAFCWLLLIIDYMFCFHSKTRPSARSISFTSRSVSPFGVRKNQSCCVQCRIEMVTSWWISNRSSQIRFLGFCFKKYCKHCKFRFGHCCIFGSSLVMSQKCKELMKSFKSELTGIHPKQQMTRKLCTLTHF
jgi:hypothetical protein